MSRYLICTDIHLIVGAENDPHPPAFLIILFAALPDVLVGRLSMPKYIANQIEML